jgi:hypothetical protein
MESLDRPTLFRVGPAALGVPVMTLDYRAQVVIGGYEATPTEGRLARLESRLVAQEVLLAALRQAILDIEFPAPPPPWYVRLGRWLSVHWQTLWRS